MKEQEEEDEKGKKHMVESQIRTRCEQSDLVIILLNLAIVPDTVIKKITSFEPGWQKQFLELMNDYKENEFKGKNFKFQDEELETRYAEFKKKVEAGDDEIQSNMKEHEKAKKIDKEMKELAK